MLFQRKLVVPERNINYLIKASTFSFYKTPMKLEYMLINAHSIFTLESLKMNLSSQTQGLAIHCNSYSNYPGGNIIFQGRDLGI